MTTPSTSYRAARTTGYMTAKLHGYYLVLWGAVRELNPGADRHSLHVQALGYERSSKDFTYQEWNKVKRLFQRLGQVKIKTPDEEKLVTYRFALRRFAAAIDADDAYLQGIWEAMGRVGGYRSWDTLDELPLADLAKILIAVKKEAARRWPDKDAMWEACHREWMAQELTNETCEEVVRAVLKCDVLPYPKDISYDDMLAILGHTKRRVRG